MVVEEIFLENGSFHPMSEGYDCCLEYKQENLDSRTISSNPGRMIENDVE
jgi:hypothetical protein